jgi:hypothetical protein
MLTIKAVQEFYMDVSRKIPRREHENGLEIGGMFFDVDAIKIVATAFNEVFREYIDFHLHMRRTNFENCRKFRT